MDQNSNAQRLLAGLAAFWLTSAAQLLYADQPAADFFERRIRPVLVQHCFECHSAAAVKTQGGLLLDSREGIRRGGDSGPAVVPGQPTESSVLDALRYESFKMPPSGKLPAAVIDDFERWIRDGAADPRDRPPSATEAAEETWKTKLAERRRWWSLQPPRVADCPTVADAAWSAEPVDRFLYSRMAQAGISPAPAADADTLLRRMSFVLTGLPPAAARVQSFRKEYHRDPDAALANLADELLNSPHFGERFARHWMDVVRYTDTYGAESDNPAKGSWEYRDYLIRAFNADVGFDQLIREQIAGDLLPNPRIDRAAGINESLIGLMFYHLGEHRETSSLRFNGVHQEMIDNKIDAFSKAFLGMTVACARCHDHKLDAISQSDYYALAGMFMTARWTTRELDVPEKHSEAIAELKHLRSRIHNELSTIWPERMLQRRGRDLREWAESHRDMLKKQALGAIGHPLARLLEATDENVAEVWQTLANEWQTARESRQRSNAADFTVLVDFRVPELPRGWVMEGTGIEHGFVADSAPLVDLEGGSLIKAILPRGYHTHALSSKLPGAVRLPAQDSIPGRFVSMRLAGGEWAGRLDVPQNAFLNETKGELIFFGDNGPNQWMTVGDYDLKNGVTRVLSEVATAPLNPNFPPRSDFARVGNVKLSNRDHGFEKRSWFSLTGVVAHDEKDPPANALDEFVGLYERTSPTNVDAAWQQSAEWLAVAVDRWRNGDTSSGDVTILNWLLANQMLPNDAQSAPTIASLVMRYREVEAGIAFPRVAISMDEREVEPVNYRINVRGNVDEDGPAVHRDFLDVFRGDHRIADSHGSGRLELAEYLSSRHNPQTARVYVNRLWQWVFGVGLVPTSSDFGRLGEPPSHPELLDWLAIRFMDDGWSTRKMVKRLVLSRAFRQSSTVSPEGIERDPSNRLWHHASTRRLEAEAIRDTLLAVSGRLDPQLYGRPISPQRIVEDPLKRLFSGPWDGDGRRSLYLQMSILDPPKFLVDFNLPAPRLPTGRRDVTNVPTQALILLNAPLVRQLADQWAERLVQDGCSSPRDRVAAMLVATYGRIPLNEDVEFWLAAATELSGNQQPTDNGELMSNRRVWADIAHTLFNTKEFIYFR